MEKITHKNNKVAIFGGTFDPFTLAHQAICKRVMDSFPIDTLYIIPTVVTYHRDEKDRWLTDKDRVRTMYFMMNELSERYSDKWKVDTHELRLKTACEVNGESSDIYDEIIGQRRFINTLLDFKCRVGLEQEIYLVLGTDSANTFKTWHRWKDICANISSLVIIEGRDQKTYEPDPEISEAVNGNIYNLFLSDKEMLQISATSIRNKFKGSSAADYWAELYSQIKSRKDLPALEWL